MKRVTIEINYDDYKDIKLHLAMIRQQINLYFKKKEQNIEIEDSDLESNLHFSNHVIIFKK